MIDGGYTLSEPSTVISLVDDRVEVLRQGKGPVEGSASSALPQAANDGAARGRATIDAVPRPRVHSRTFGPLDPLLDLFLRHLQVERGLAAKTVDAYGDDLRRYLDDLHRAGLDLGATDRAAARAHHLATTSRRGSGRRSQARHLASIRMFHRFLLADRLSHEDPAG